MAGALGWGAPAASSLVIGAVLALGAFRDGIPERMALGCAVAAGLSGIA